MCNGHHVGNPLTVIISIQHTHGYTSWLAVYRLVRNAVHRKERNNLHILRHYTCYSSDCRLVAGSIEDPACHFETHTCILPRMKLGGNMDMDLALGLVGQNHNLAEVLTHLGSLYGYAAVQHANSPDISAD